MRTGTCAVGFSFSLFVTCGTHPRPVVGRIKDIIIRGGEVRRSGHESWLPKRSRYFLLGLLVGLQTMQNLFPVQIENALTDHPGIREAAAIAVPDTKYGEVVGAWIAREPGTDVSRAEVRRAVADAMNPQVSDLDQLSRYALVLGNVHVHSCMRICNGVC